MAKVKAAEAATKTKTNKFVQTLSASSANIKEARARNLSEVASIEALTLVQNLKREKLNLENKIANLTDLAPETNDSLRPGSKNFDAPAWIKELFETKMDLKLKEIEIEEAQSIVDEWFSDISEDEA